jgi:hypothetical protein
VVTPSSESQITVTAPPGAAPGSVPVTVTTAAGSATSATGFIYVRPISTGGTPGTAIKSCHVPNLVGKKLKAAKRALAASRCALGKVRKARPTLLPRAKVVAQSPKPGMVLPIGAKVNVRVR